MEGWKDGRIGGGYGRRRCCKLLLRVVPWLLPAGFDKGRGAVPIKVEPVAAQRAEVARAGPPAAVAYRDRQMATVALLARDAAREAPAGHLRPVDRRRRRRRPRVVRCQTALRGCMKVATLHGLLIAKSLARSRSPPLPPQTRKESLCLLAGRVCAIFCPPHPPPSL